MRLRYVGKEENVSRCIAHSLDVRQVRILRASCLMDERRGLKLIEGAIAHYHLMRRTRRGDMSYDLP